MKYTPRPLFAYTATDCQLKNATDCQLKNSVDIPRPLHAHFPLRSGLGWVSYGCWAPFPQNLCPLSYNLPLYSIYPYNFCCCALSVNQYASSVFQSQAEFSHLIRLLRSKPTAFR